MIRERHDQRTNILGWECQQRRGGLGSADCLPATNKPDVVCLNR